MTPFTPDQWLIVGLIFVLGLILGMWLLAGGKWKRRYREEHARAVELERENKTLVRERDELNALRERAARHPVGDADARRHL